MHNPHQDTQDHRSNSGMEDSPSMTIDFLRARLLAERSVSKIARQRVVELEKMVDELEEQLKIVSLQRKMAEKATEDVLAILESQGVSDISEEFDSSSDQEAHQGCKVGDSSTHEEERFVISKVKRNDQEEFSGSDADSSLVPGRSLSWKGRIDSPRSRDKYKDLPTRRRSNFSSIGSSSPRHHLGKSCRQIKHKETRSVVEGFSFEAAKSESQENGASSEGYPNYSYGRPEKLRERSEYLEEKGSSSDSLSGTKENQRNSDLDFNAHGRDKDMEKALQHQAQLIGQNEEMEKVQREWEEKFIENNPSTPDSCDPGNHSDITDERDENKAHMPPSHAGVANGQAQEAESAEGHVHRPTEMPKVQTNGFLPASHRDKEGLPNQLNRSNVVSSSQVQEFAFPTENGKQSQESGKSYAHQPSHVSHPDLLLPGSTHTSSADTSSGDAGNGFHKGYASGGRNDLYALVPHDSQDRLGGVLDALKQAKLSLQQTMTRLPLVDGTSAPKSIEPSIPPSNGHGVEVPVGCPGLFRLPTDFAAEEAVTQSRFLGSSCLPSVRYYPENGVSVTSANQFVRSPYAETRPTFSAHASPYVETRTTFSAQASPFVETRANFSASATDRFVINPYIETRPNLLPNSPDLFATSPYDDTRSKFSAENRILSVGRTESGSKVSTPQPQFDPYTDMGIASSRYTSPTYLSYPSVPDPTPWITSDGALTRALPRRPVGAPTDRFSFYEHIRPDMYR